MAEEILRRMSITDSQGVYALGCEERRVTIYSQQVRALNLAWALNELSRISPNTRVAVVGGGAAGLTAALALGRLGAKVKVFEQHQKLLPRFRGNTQRYLHPHAFDWPQRNSEMSLADLPLMNWQAGIASAVAVQLERAWTVERISSGNVAVNTSSGITGIDSNQHRLLTGDKGEPEDFDIVVVAVGVGTEKQKAGTPTYWQNDSLSQIYESPKRVLVSGNGDGGLIDVARACLHDFDHSRLFTQLLNSSYVYSLRTQLLEIESRALVGECRIDEEYRQLDFTRVAEHINGQWRQDREVVLNVAGGDIFRTDTMILNRVVLECLRRCGLEIWSGRLSEEITHENGVFIAKIDNAEERTFDAVILRHGPVSDLKRFPNLQKAKIAEPDPTRIPKWSDNYFQIKRVSQGRRPIPERFSVVEFDPGFGLESRAWSMNEVGSVVGWTYLPVNRAHSFYIWHGTGLPPELGHIPGAGKLAATAINKHGDYIVTTEGGSGQAWLVSGGRLSVLESPMHRAMPYDLNSDKIIVGYCVDEKEAIRACVWQESAVKYLDDLGHGGVALQINDSGVIVGHVTIHRNGNLAAARWSNNEVEFYYPPAGYYNARAFRVNSHGVAVGYLMKNQAPSDFFIWPPGSPPQIIGQGEAYGVNDLGYVVGRSGENGAFLFGRDQMTWLNDCVDGEWIIEWPFALLNDFRMCGVVRKDGISRAALLVPES